MKKYYIRRTDFYNAYALCWADDAHPVPKDAEWERITRREAEQLCRAESDRRMWEPSSAYYAPDVVRPWWLLSGDLVPKGEGWFTMYHPEVYRPLAVLRQSGRVLEVMRELEV